MASIAEIIISQISNFDPDNDFHQKLLDLSVFWVEYLSSVPTEVVNTDSGNTGE